MLTYIKYTLTVTLLIYSAIVNALDTLSWNLESGGAKLETLQTQLGSLDKVDIYGFSEVDVNWQAGINSALNNFGTGSYDSIISRQGGSDRLLIAFDKTRYELVSSQELTEINIQNRVRPALVGRFKNRVTGQEFFFMVNHLYRSNKRARHKQSKILNKWIQQQEIPVIAVGDYNYDWDIGSDGERRDKGFNLLTKNDAVRWVEPETKIKTQCSERYNGILDFVFISDELAHEDNVSKVLHEPIHFCNTNQQNFSDHRPIWARLAFDNQTTFQNNVPLPISNKQKEVDEIYSLLSLAVVFKRWQKDSLTRDELKGHNIGSVLVDDQNKPVFWARNARHATNNASQHGEVRLITNFLNCPNTPSYLSGDEGNYTLYSSLEPCLMCTGMMALTKVSRGVYVQADPGFGHVMERLTHDHSNDGGPGPYPRTFPMVQSLSIESKQLDKQFENWMSSENSSITDFLRSKAAKSIYSDAYNRLEHFESQYGNEEIVHSARMYLDSVPTDYVSDMRSQCR